MVVVVVVVAEFLVASISSLFRISTISVSIFSDSARISVY